MLVREAARGVPLPPPEKSRGAPFMDEAQLLPLPPFLPDDVLDGFCGL